MKVLTYLALFLQFLETASCDRDDKPWNVKLQARSTSTTARGQANRSTAVNLPLANYVVNTNIQWYGTVEVGTLPQEFRTLFDPGSSNLLIGRVGCSGCSNHTLFDPSASSTFSHLPGINASVPFDTGATAEPLGSPAPAIGKVVTDVVTVAGISISNQAFLLCDQFSPALDEVDLDGVFGLGLPGSTGLDLDSNVTIHHWLWTAAAAGEVPQPVYSLNLNEANRSVMEGELTLGGTDSSKYEGDIHKIVHTPNFYLNHQLVTNVSGQPLVSNYSVMDAGTAYIQAPDVASTEAIYSAISSDIVQIDALGAWGASCEKMATLQPILTFTFGLGNQAINLTVPKENFNLGPYAKNSSYCQALILSPPTPLEAPGSIWILGSPLLMGHYTVWDGGNFQLGFAELRRGLEGSVYSFDPLSAPNTNGSPPVATGSAVLWGVPAVAYLQSLLFLLSYISIG
ncbi:acid protease [Polychaeton citri CBS 116435]|uniref:Acid protease n=1 Tax=Polychaeton citri CBS 116435 TaxID=1314669 RepID=A0A9P4ULC8_9PEZI|nr:acid protease [Polychaeton citri CBS 116435]